MSLIVSLAGMDSLRAAPPKYFVTTLAGMVPPLANPIATKQYLDDPSAVAYDPKGDLYYATQTQIWRLNADGTDTPIAGGGKSRSTTAGGNPFDVAFTAISSIVFDSQGDLFVVDGDIFKLTSEGEISLLVSNIRSYFQFGAYVVAVDGSDNLYAIGYTSNKVLRYQAATSNFVTVAQLADPNDGFFGLAASGHTLYLLRGASFAEMLRFDLESDGFLTSIPTPTNVFAVAAGANGSIYVASNDMIFETTASRAFQAFAGTGLPGYSGDGGPPTQAAIAPSGAASGPGTLSVNPLNGDLAVSEGANHVFRVIHTATRVIQTIAGQPHFGGDDGPAILALMDAYAPYPGANALAADKSGDLYFLDRNNSRLRKITPSGTITTVAGTGILGATGDGGKATQANISSHVDGNVVVDQAGNIYFVNTGSLTATAPGMATANDTVRMIDLSGNIHTVAGGGSGTISGGLPATSVNLSEVRCIAVDLSGNLYIAHIDQSITGFGSGKIQILKVNTSGILSVFAGSLSRNFNHSPDGTLATQAYLGTVDSMVTDRAGLLYYTDAEEQLIRMVTSHGTISTIAGVFTVVQNVDAATAGPALSTHLARPERLAIDSSGNLYFLNEALYGPQIVLIDTTGNLAPVGGNPRVSFSDSVGYTGDGADALKTAFISLDGLTVDPSGNIYLLDSGVYVRKLAPYDPNHPPPFVTSRGIVGAGASVPAVSAVSPDGDATIYGANFAANHTLMPSDLVNGKVPATLAGVCVSFGGTPAAMLGVYPNQINVQVPTLPPGPVTVQVTLNCGQPNAVSSNIAGIMMQAASPEFFSFLPDPTAGNNPIAAVNAVTGALIGPTGLLPGASFTPARVGDIVAAYGTGWGSTNPALGLGVIPGAAANLTLPYMLTLGGTALPEADILYAGASPCCAGLYQINFRVPAGTSSGNQPLVITVDGIPSPAHAFITVQ
ncbi:MAG TPA: hypothetical protein VMH80_12270 [Bryobacteraceae bacterium]|nr:hypothetical protein [Bryobacteraceae bacterium]